MDNKLDWVWNEIVIAYVEILFQHLPGGTEENNLRYQLG
jgi:hypothetical protein